MSPESWPPVILVCAGVRRPGPAAAVVVGGAGDAVKTVFVNFPDRCSKKKKKKKKKSLSLRLRAMKQPRGER